MSDLRRRRGQPYGDDPTMDTPPNVRGDRGNIALLLLLYILQGIPLGLNAAIPLLLQNQGASFKHLAEFSVTIWPFSFKLLWAPLVDAIYSKRLGRRKTWLVPSQYLIGFFMLFLSLHIEEWIKPGADSEPQIVLLTTLFFIMNFLAATQDIAVDGWALTMLKPNNKSYASTCNSVGQSAGYFIGYVVFITLESSEFCNSYFRTIPESKGLITLPGFLYFWGIVYLVVTTLVTIFKTERTEVHEHESSTGYNAAISSYKTLFKILKLKNIQRLAFLLLTMGFAACDSLTGPKLIAGGVSKEKIASLAFALVPLQIFLPIIIAKYNSGRRPLDLYLRAYPYRIMYNFVAALFVYLTPIVLKGKDSIPLYFYVTLLLLLSVHTVIMTTMFVQAMSFFATIAVPSAGGTYMTLLNTLHNAGGTWTATAALWLVDILTFKKCSNTGNSCSILKECENEGSCDTWIDGFYLEIVLCSVIGYLWYRWSKNPVLRLQSEVLDSWVLAQHRS